MTAVLGLSKFKGEDHAGVLGEENSIQYLDNYEYSIFGKMLQCPVGISLGPL